MRRAVAGSAVAAFVATLPAVPLLATASCDGHECDPNVSKWGYPTCEGVDLATCCSEGCMLDEDDWVSTPTAANWLNFPANGTIKLYLGAWTGKRVPDTTSSVIDILSRPGPEDPLPDGDSPDNAVTDWAAAAGSAGVFLNQSSDGGYGFVEVANLTCSPTYARIRIHLDPPAAPPDGGPVTDDMMGPCWKRSQKLCE
jgi:hypothetical protein